MKNQISLFLDSGAYSAWSKGIDIDIQEYIKFIKKHEKYIDVYANLDVIGDDKKTFENQKIMETAGLRPLPCFHYGDDIKYLERYMEDYDYIALGGMVGVKSGILEWLDFIFNDYICGSDGIPKVKVHGFGLTSVPLMTRFPWWSVDSTSWVLTGRFGAIFVPRKTNGEYDYLRVPHKINISDKSPSQKDTGKHISTFSDMERKEIRSYIKSKGYSISGLASDYKLRDEINIIYFLDLEKNLPEWPWAFKLKKAKGFGL